jgi:UDP-N-acetylglucosamine 2-epimerase
MKDMVNPYGDGKASARIVDVLAAVELTDELLQKRITY